MVEAGAPSEGKAGFAAESPPGAGALNKDDGCALWVVGAPPPNKGLGVDEAEGVDSAGLAPPNRPPDGGGAAGVVPNDGLLAAGVAAAPAPNRPPVEGVCD